MKFERLETHSNEKTVTNLLLCKMVQKLDTNRSRRKMNVSKLLYDVGR